jgi:hypothetical protein
MKDPLGEQHWVTQDPRLAEIWNALGGPLPEGFHPIGVTAVLVAANNRGQISRYPLYANISSRTSVEQNELHHAISAIERLLQQLRDPTEQAN